MRKLGWLHLTDLHEGMGGQRPLWSNVEEELFADLGRHHDVSGPWQLVFFTGDLTQKGLKEEFEQLDEKLGRLWERLRALGSKPVLLPVPGNHDLERPAAGDSTLLTLTALWDKEEEVQKRFWGDPSSDTRQLVEKAFANYAGWWSRAKTKLPEPDLRPGMLPGEYSVSLEVEGIRVGAVGLNSAFLHLRDQGAKGGLAIDARQLQDACGGDSASWCASQDICFLLTHHPENWLCGASQEAFRGEIDKPGRFAAHLFGHMHEPRAYSRSESGANPRRSMQGCSLFGLDKAAGGKVDRKHGYSAGRIELVGEGATLRLFPRVATRSHAGPLHLARDSGYSLVEADGGTGPEAWQIRRPLVTARPPRSPRPPEVGLSLPPTTPDPGVPLGPPSASSDGSPPSGTTSAPPGGARESPRHPADLMHEKREPHRWGDAVSGGLIGALPVVARQAAIPLLFSVGLAGPAELAIEAAVLVGLITSWRHARKVGRWRQLQLMLLQVLCHPTIEDLRKLDPTARMNVMRVRPRTKSLEFFHSFHMENDPDAHLVLRCDQGVAGAAQQNRDWAVGDLEGGELHIGNRRSGDPFQNLTADQRKCMQHLTLAYSYPIWRLRPQGSFGKLVADRSKAIGAVNIDSQRPGALGFYTQVGPDGTTLHQRVVNVLQDLSTWLATVL